MKENQRKKHKEISKSDLGRIERRNREDGTWKRLRENKNG